MLRKDGAGLLDGQLLERFVNQNDEAAFEALVRRHGPMVFGVCRRILRNEADTEDAFQATFLVLVKKAASIRTRGAVGNWLYGVAHKAALKVQAMNQRRQAKEREAGMRRELRAPAEDVQQLHDLLHQELQALPNKYRAPIVLCDLEDMSIKEAARQLACPPGTIGTRLARGRILLARRLARKGLTLSGGLIGALLSQHAASAAVPNLLLSSTIKAASMSAAGEAVAAGLISAKVALLTERVVTAMLFTKLKMTAVLLLAVTLGVTAASMLTNASLAEEKPQGKEVATAPKEGNQPQLAVGTTGGPEPLPAVKQPGPLPAIKQPEPLPEAKSLRIQAVPKKLVNVAATRVIPVDEKIRLAMFHPDGKGIIAVSAPGEDTAPVDRRYIRLWDVGTGEAKFKILEDVRTDALAVSPRGKSLLIGDWDSKAPRVLDISDLTNAPKEVLGIAGCKGACSAAFAPDGKAFVLGTDDGSVYAYDMGNGRLQWNQRGHDRDVRSIVFSPDGALVATAGDDKTVLLVEATTGRVQFTLEGHKDKVNSVAFSPDGKLLASASYDGTARLWDVQTGKGKQILKGEDQSLRSVVFSPDGKILAIGGLKNVGVTALGLWSVTSGEQQQILTGHKGGAFSVSFSPDGKMLMAGGGRELGLWQVK